MKLTIETLLAETQDAPHPHDSTAEPTWESRHKFTLWLALALLAVAVVTIAAWSEQSSQPLLTGPASLLWMTAVGLCAIRRDGSGEPNVEVVLLSLFVGGCGWLGDVRLVQQLAASVVLLAYCRRTAAALLIVATLSWLPATSFLFGAASLPLRVTSLFLAGVALSLRDHSFELPFRRVAGPLLTGGSVLLAAVLFAGERSHESHLVHLPQHGLLFQSVDLPLAEAEAKHLAHVEVVKRRYRLPAGTFDLLAIDGSQDRHAIHDPTYCHRGDGWQIADRRELPLTLGSASWVRYRRGEESTECVFWFTDGTRQSASPWWYWASATLRRLSDGHSGCEPVLVVLQPADESQLDWRQVLRELPALAKF